MNLHDLRQLQSLESYPALSILLPTYRTAPENRKDPIRVKNLAVEARNRLLQEFNAREIASLLTRLDEVLASIDYEYLLDGLAIFVNKDLSFTYELPFKPETRVIIDKTFATRDLVRALHHTERYWVLALSDNASRLFEGSGDTLIEIKSEGFPMSFEGPGGATRLPGGQGIEPSTYGRVKRQQFFKSVDDAYRQFAVDDPLPLVVAGVDRNITFFQEASAHTSSIISTIRGNYDRATVHELAQRIWPLVYEQLKEQRQEALTELDIAVGAHRCASTIGEVWRMAKEGRGDTLFVEKGFLYPAHVDATGFIFSPAEDATEPGVLDDAVDEMIETVLLKGGHVVFVDDGMLALYQRIALVLRY